MEAKFPHNKIGEMALNGNKTWIEFPYEIKEAEGDIREQFIRDFQGRKKRVERISAER